MSAADVRPVLRTLRDVLEAPRVHVAEAEEHYRALLLTPAAEDAAEVLERVDGAIADADEVLS